MGGATGVKTMGCRCDDDARSAGSLVERRNYCSLAVEGDAGARRMVLRVYDAEGRALWERTLTAEELRTPSPGE